MASSFLGAEDGPKPGVVLAGVALMLVCEAMNLSRSRAMSSERRSAGVLLRSIRVPFVSMVAVGAGMVQRVENNGCR